MSVPDNFKGISPIICFSNKLTAYLHVALCVAAAIEPLLFVHASSYVPLSLINALR